jgi:hypothetical protein
MLEPGCSGEHVHRQLIWRSQLHPMRWLLTKALYPYVLIAATARAARAAAEAALAARRPTLNEQLAAAEGEGREIQAPADALQLASVSDISAGLAAYELTRNPDLLNAGYVARPHPATWW